MQRVSCYIYNDMLIINQVSKSFGQKRALDDVSMTVQDGTIYGLLGPNGAGKTTLIRIINGITAPDSGEALLDGERISLDKSSLIGYLPEERGLYKKMSVYEQVMYLAQLKGMSATKAREEMNKWFKRFDITSWQKKKIEELSKGMAQKVQFITTVIHRPRLLILDEPFSGFDPINAEMIRQEILRLNQEGTTVILSTHNMESVEMLCQEISLINNGRIVLQGNVQQIRHQNRSNIYRVVYETDGRQIEKKVQKLPDESSNNLLKRLAKDGEIVAFEEILPTMNEIFIKTVQS